MNLVMTAASKPVEASILPGNKYEQGTPAPLTRSHSASLHTVHPQGTTEERKGKSVVTTLNKHYKLERKKNRELGAGIGQQKTGKLHNVYISQANRFVRNS